MTCKVTVHDVGHGVFISVETGNGRRAIIDCGGDGDPCSIPMFAEDSDWRRRALDYLVLSHPNEDHIRHLPRLLRTFDVKAITCNEAITEQKLLAEREDAIGPSNRECFDAYYGYVDADKAHVPDEDSPEHPDWGGGWMLHCFCNHDKGMSVNDLSVAVFIVSGKFAMLYGADLEQAGWEALMKNPKFVDMLRKTKMLVASHHGHKNGFYRGAFDVFRPMLTIVSDGPSADSVTERYDEVTEGITIGGDKRKVLTTRKDKTITVYVDYSGNFRLQLGSHPAARC